MEPLGNVPYCKGLWSVISSTTSRCEKALVVEEIKNATELLKEGLIFFKPFTESSLEKVQKSNPGPRMLDLVSKLATFLNLDATIAWDLTLNYMIYEYRNSGETFASHLADITSMKVLIEDIWTFYYSERITLIKCLKLIIEYRDNKRHPYQSEFSEFFKKASLESILESSLKQIDRLKSASIANRSHLLTDDHLHKLYNSTLVEMRELLHIVTMLLDTVQPSDFQNIYESVCGEPRRLAGTKSHEDKEKITKQLEEIRHCQIALFVVALDVTKRYENSASSDEVYNWVERLRENIQELVEPKCRRDGSPEDGPLLLVWMLVNFAVEPENSELLNRFRPCGVRAVQLDVFRTLQSVLDSEVINESTRYAQVVRTSIYNLLSLLCSFVDEDRLSNFEGIFDVVASILRYPETATEFWNDRNEEGGLWPLFHRAVSLFPYRFEPLTRIATGLANASLPSAKKIAARLEELDSVTLEEPIHRNFTPNAGPRQPYRPYEKECTLHRNEFTIPDNCERIVLDSDKEIVLWRTKSRYGDAFHYKIELLFYYAGSGIMNVVNQQTSLPEHVTLGFTLLEALLASDVDLPLGMVIPTELSLEVINRFCHSILPRSLYLLVAACCRVTSKLALKYPDEIFTRMRVGIYPKFNDWYQDIKELARAFSFDGGLVASWLSGIETIEHRYPILNAYLDTLYNYLVSKHSEEAMYNMEIPGMVFLLQGVLPKLDSWYFTSETERIELWLKSMSCIHHALDVNLPKNDPRKKLQLVVAYSLLYLEPRHALLKLVRTGERNLRNQMMNESDWISGKGFKVIESVRLALSLVNRLLMFRQSLGLSDDERSPLEVALYTSPSLPTGLLIVPTIVNYLYVEFSPSLQAMAVSLLKKFAQGFSMSLLVCMGMDGTSIRVTFASRLMSPTCSAKVKVTILELVAVCLERQPGLTEALFNIMHQAEQKRMFPKSADQFLTEGCSHFIELYLERISKEKEIVYDKLYDNTMNLIRAIWYNRNTILVNYFRKREKFWNQMFAPLFRPLVSGSRGYAYLIDIATLELFESAPPLLPENDFTKNLEIFLYKDNHWERFIEYILANPASTMDTDSKIEEENNSSNESPLYEANIEAWYHFIVTLTDNKVSSELMTQMEASRVQFMMRYTLDSLSLRIKRTKTIGDARITMLLASLALRCVFTWKLKCVDEQQAFISRIVQLMEDIFHSYDNYGAGLRRILVSLLLGCIQLVKSAMAEDKASLEYLLIQSCLLSNIELRKLSDAVKKTQEVQAASGNIKHVVEEENDIIDGKISSDSTKSTHTSTPATLTISMVTQLLQCINQQDPLKYGNRSVCLHLRQLAPDLMSCLSTCLQSHRYVGFSRAGLELLGMLARSTTYNPPPRPIDEQESIAKLWLALVPPESLRNSMLECLYDDRTCQGQWRCQDWWMIYTLGLEFITGLIMSSIGFGGQSSCQSTYVTSVVIFLGSHENQLTEVATLLRHTADPRAIDLVQSLVALISALTMRTAVWEMIQPSVREGLMNCMYLIYDSTVNLLLRPRILKFIIDGVSVESAEDLHWCDEKLPSNELKLVVNKLIVINWWCAQCFVRFSPRLNALVDTIYTQNFWHTPLAEINFGPPQMSINSGPSLTYGTIISSTQLFTQALNVHLAINSSPKTIQRTPSKDGMDSAKREWERSTPEYPRKIHPKDLRRVFNVSGPAHAYFDHSGYASSHGLLGNPRLLRRPYDPLICENTILSRTTPFSHHTRHVSKNGTQNQSVNVGQSIRVDANPWFDSMDKNNSRLALEINLVLVLCQTLEGVKSPRLALRDRQLIARETANEIGMFFDFLEQRASGLSDWDIQGALVGVGMNEASVKIIKPPVNVLTINAQLSNQSTINKAPVNAIEYNPGEGTSRDDDSQEKEVRLDDNIVSTGCYNISSYKIKFLSLLGKLFKSTLESLDSAQYG
ncbi:GSCOCG00000272001-RA-CDS [Cotesia congregata]|uniref:Similar to Nup188: Nucleoporin Nup188 (Drosophila melanogaster) n=1 Tax=Cotesia congregata TaxID=51543 RepID=A0A8J2HHL2_COTCN|nr:GSCOCG00000272001-RA-CDS [Cotesia congregata]CAG5101200.1 Similar to Nup188: Nucleoporin Nup188 (Drosophila melanogaster) [Cotesia congregata]